MGVEDDARRIEELAAELAAPYEELGMLARRILTASNPPTGGGGGGFTDPTDIAGLWVWLDADALTGLSDGDNVTTWTDESGNSRDFTSSGAGVPTYETNEINTTMPAVLFAQDKALRYNSALLGDSASTDDFSVAFVYKHTSAAVDGIFGVDGDRTGGTRGWSLTSDGGADELLFHDGINNAGVHVTTTGNASDPNVWHYAVLVVDGTSVTLRVDGAEWTGTRTFTSTSGLSDVGMFLGVQRNQSTFYYYFDGFIAELFAYDVALTSGNITDVESYLTSKWGL